MGWSKRVKKGWDSKLNPNSVWHGRLTAAMEKNRVRLKFDPQFSLQP